MSRLTEEQKTLIREKLKAGETVKQIMPQAGCSKDTIYRIQREMYASRELRDPKKEPEERRPYHRKTLGFRTPYNMRSFVPSRY